MLTPFEQMVAFRYLRARREEGLISVIALFSLVGIALGVATLIVVLAVMNGVRGELIKSIIGLEGHVSVYAEGKGIDHYDDLAKMLAANPGVKAALPKVEGQVMASYKGQATGAMVVAYRYDDLKQKDLLVKRIVAGDISALDESRSVDRASLEQSSMREPAGSQRGLSNSGVVIGKRMAEKMRIHVGDDLTLISPEGRATIAGMVPRVKAYKVVGLFSIGMFAYDNGMVLMSFSDAQTYFKLRDNGKDDVSSIELMSNNAEDAQQLAASISHALGSGYRVYDWKSSNSGIFQAVIVQRNVMFLILMLIILVASFNIISSLIMLVREKSRDVAVLRTMGASQSSIMKIFIACGAMVGVIGTCVGVVLGLVIAFNTENIQLWLESMMGHRLFADELYFLSHLPSKVDGSETVMVALMALALSFLATIYPARRAARLDPAEVLRYE